VNWVVQGYGVEAAIMDAQAYGNKAREALYHFPVSHNREVLEGLIDFVLARRS
jgi:heptaprenyl diphosphate synthase